MIARLVRRLEEEQAQLAQDALGQPSGRDAFEYGRMVGIYAGLQLAKETLLNIQQEDERRGFDL